MNESYQEIEEKWATANQLDPKGMVACSSGTAALHLGFEASRLRLGSYVIVPDLTMVACPRAVVLAGLRPVFSDCQDDLNVNPRNVSTAITRDVSAILAVHTYGRRCNMDLLSDVAKNNVFWLKMLLVEDLAEAHGVLPHKDTDVACWSFYKNKIVYGEEGGAVWFKDLKSAALARQLRSLGFTDQHDFNHIPRGHNYRMSNLHAKAILPSIEEMPTNLGKRRKIEELYNQKIPQEWQMPERDSVWVYDLRIPGMDKEKQNTIVKELNKRGIAARHCFKPMTIQDEFRGCQSMSRNALRLSQEVLYLPVLTSMTEWDVDRVVESLLEVVQSVS